MLYPISETSGAHTERGIRRDTYIDDLLTQPKPPKKNIPDLASSKVVPKPKDELVERVIESIKMMSKKEEEAKKNQKREKEYDTALNYKNSAISDRLVTRRRTNTFHATERPNMLVYP